MSAIWICQHVFLGRFFLPLFHEVMVEAVSHSVIDIMMYNKKYAVDLFISVADTVPTTLEIS